MRGRGPFRKPTSLLALALALAPVALGASDAGNTLCSLDDTSAPACTAIRLRDPANVHVFPFSAIGKLMIADGRNHCTAVLVSHATILTAAHCLLDNQTGQALPVTALQFQPSNTGSPVSITSIAHPVPAHPPSDPALDFALLTLAQPLADPHRPIPLFQGRFRNPVPGVAVLAGYAALTPDQLSIAADCGRPLPVSRQLMATCSAMPGDSGAPLLWQGQDGLGNTGTFLLGITTAISAQTAPLTTRFAPWHRLRDAVGTEILMGN